MNLLATASDGVARLRELILTLAVQGNLVPQDASDEPACVLLKKIRAEKDRLIAEGKIRRDKPLAEIAEDEKPFELPQGWAWVRLGTASKKITDGTHHSPANFPAGDFKYLSAKNIKSWGIDISSATYVPQAIHEEIFARCDPEYGDILYIKDGATTGILTINTLREPFSLLSSVGVIKPSCGLTSEFLALVMRSPFFYQAMRDGMTGVAITRVTLSKLGDAKLPLPPLAEQSRIVTRVEELMRLCDALQAKARLEATQHAQLVATLLSTLTASTTPEELTENWHRVAIHFDLLLDRPEAVDALEQTILQLAVRGLLVPQDPKDEPASTLLQSIRAEKDRLIAQGKIKRDKPLPPVAEDEKPFDLPQGWEWARVGSIGVTQTGGTPASNRPEYFDGDFPFIGPGQITPNGNILPAEKFISESGRMESAVAEIGDVLMVCIGGSISKCAAASYATAFNQQINSIHPVLVSAEYVLNAMSSSDFMVAVVYAATGSATPIISKGKWDVLLLPVPPLAEQSRIVARVASLRALCADLRQRLTTARNQQGLLAQVLVQEVA
ncbi:MAG: restriction endonuclease subunit S [Polaromonas sp.]|uniref:restriction endonuclease subunit S n=1 Tax=Polaromonas sp. TaxID=1869339 RepID=UPI00182B9E39|nr:restriction endonuclease subunit S [Polaromonas sp.]MBA3594126.1 restriction endonuclease subunit S [Polaromonas sp.]